MEIWAFATASKEAVEFVYSSLENGFSRFGWSYVDTADLKLMKERGWENLNKLEQHCYKNAHFLLEIKTDDWIVHVNVPELGKCSVAKVISGYEFDKNNNKIGVGNYSENGDFKHIIPVDPDTIITFSRNDKSVSPYISRRLKLSGRYWKIHDSNQFLQTIEKLKTQYGKGKNGRC